LVIDNFVSAIGERLDEQSVSRAAALQDRIAGP